MKYYIICIIAQCFICRVLPRDRGSILFCTTGMLLQFLQGDPALKEFSHIILDEIHERSTESDFVLALLKLIISKVRLIHFIHIKLYVNFCYIKKIYFFLEI